MEQTAIQEACLKHGWQRLFFIMLDKTSLPPKWLPTYWVRFNYPDFGLQQAVGAIKARVQENGGAITPITALKRAELSQRETQYLKERDQLRSPFGDAMVQRAATELFTEIKRLCSEIEASGHASIQFAWDTERVFGVDATAHECHLRNQVSLVARLTLHPEAGLVVREFDKRLPMRRENLAYLNRQPQMVRETRFLPDMNRAREYGWTEEGNPSSFLSTEALAESIVGRFIDLSERAERGEFIRPETPSSPRRGRRR